MKRVNDNCKVSIVIHIYNSQNCLEECINSVLNQLYKNIEIIFINDGSTDDSISICEKIQKLNGNIYIKKSEKFRSYIS